jgi:hypothetical protein
MANEKKLTRNNIIQTLVNALQPLDYVHAFWEGGAAAFNRIDEWSDIDLYLVVDDTKIDETFLAVEEAIKSLSHVELKYEIPQTAWPGVSQAFYRLKDTSKYLLLDIAVLKISSTEKFLEPKIHGNVVFFFNKSSKVQHPSFDEDALILKLQERLERLKVRFDMFNIFVQKEINRGNYLEAVDSYHTLTLATLVEVLRIKHNPFHHDFKMRYIHYEIPSKITRKLEHLYFAKDEKDLQRKYQEATKWFHETISEIEQKEIERLVRMR